MDFIKKSYFKYGLWLSALTLLCLFIMEITGQNNSFDNKSPLIFFLMVIAPALVFYSGIKNLKKSQKNKLTVKEGVQEGIRISIVYGIISPFIFLLYYQINPGILESIKIGYGMSEATDSMIISVDMLAQLIMALFFGAIYSTLISFLLKSKKK